MEPTTLLALVGVLAIASVAAWLGAGSLRSLDGIAGWAGGRDWPAGVQESDAPHFAVDHWLGHEAALEVDDLTAEDPALPCEFVELGAAPVHRVTLQPKRRDG
ncbi:MAG TPA: hypothetical protein VD763_08860 [Candidatus Saccharimonadales bacterium]|nr:hypothetical protein [Candidatus Saccharimonadales bacterium]